MATIACTHCGHTWEQEPLANYRDALSGRCPDCYRPLAEVNARRIPGWRLELLRDEHARNQRGGW